MSSWEGVHEFVAVAEVHSFTQAAQKLSTSVAQVSRRISLLEARLAVKLFHRTTRQVSLTEAGLVYYQQCRVLVEGLEQAELAVTQLQVQPKGVIKVTAPVTYGEQKLVPLLYQFMHQYPQIELELQLTNQKIDLIDSGVDVAVRLGQLDDSSLIAKRLSERALYVCATPQYLLEHGTPKRLADLSFHQCLVGTHSHWRFKQNRQSSAIRVQGKLQCNSGNALLMGALQHLGLIQLPDYYVQSLLDEGQLIEVLSEFKDDREGVWALYPHNRHLSSKVRLLVDFLADAL